MLSTTSKNGQPDADLHPIQNPDRLLSAKTRQGQPDADLHPVQSPEQALVSNKQEWPADADLHPVQTQSMLLSTTHRERLNTSRLTDYLLSLRVRSCQHQNNEFKQNINLLSVYNQSTFSLTSG